MKRLFTLLMLAFVAMSCEEIQDFIDPKGHGLVFLEGEMKAYFDDKGDTKNYKFQADLAWSAEVSADWVEVDPTSGPAGENKIKIKVDKNKSDERRTGYVDITLSNDKSYRIELEQLASGDSLDDVTPSTSIPNNEIWYTNGSTTEPTTPYNADAFGANIVSNTFDAEKECWVIKFDGDVTTIGDEAFYLCSSLTSVTIPDSVTTIGEWAFYLCSSLTSVTIPDGVTTIGYAAFWACYSLTSVTIGDRVTTIGEDAFWACSSLTSITIPDNVTTIGGSAFALCSSLTSVTIGDSVTSIGDAAFLHCSSLTEFRGKYASEDGRCLIIDGTLNSFAPAGLAEYTIPDSVTTIGDSAFSHCSSLTSVTIPDSVTILANRIFEGCSALSSITIPDSVTTIGECAFAACDSLTSITIPDSVTTIGEGAFSKCYSLTSITIPDGVTSIGKDAFAYCSSLTSVTIPDSVTTIRVGAFCDCESLTSVTIPDSVTTIEDSAFWYCSSLTSVYCKAVTPPAGGYGMFDDNASGRKIYVPMESVEAYKSAQGWSDYADAIEGYNFIDNGDNGDDTEIGITKTEPEFDEIWYTNGSTTEATNPYNTDSFGCAILSNTYDESIEKWVIKFDGWLYTIGYEAFCNCEDIISITLPHSVTTLSEYAFYGCRNLTDINLTDSVTTIEGGAFQDCSGLTNIVIPDSVTTIGSYAFSGCISLTDVTLSNGITTIDNGVFSWCQSLKNIDIPDQVTSIGNDVFYDCRSLESICIPDSVTSIGVCAYQGCSSLTSVTIPENVTNIGSYAFSGTMNLSTVYCKATTPPTYGGNVFQQEVSDITIYVPMDSIEDYKTAIGWKSYAESFVGYDF